MKYRTNKELLGVIKAFENCSIERGKWGHPEHLILAYHYALGNNYPDAFEKMKSGLYRLLEAFEVDLGKEKPYHETMTVFWMKTVYEFSRQHPVMSPESVDNMISRFDKHYPGKFYSDELLMSEKARTEYVEPDLNGLKIES